MPHIAERPEADILSVNATLCVQMNLLDCEAEVAYRSKTNMNCMSFNTARFISMRGYHFCQLCMLCLL